MEDGGELATVRAAAQQYPRAARLLERPCRRQAADPAADRQGLPRRRRPPGAPHDCLRRQPRRRSCRSRRLPRRGSGARRRASRCRAPLLRATRRRRTARSSTAPATTPRSTRGRTTSACGAPPPTRCTWVDLDRVRRRALARRRRRSPSRTHSSSRSPSASASFFTIDASWYAFTQDVALAVQVPPRRVPGGVINLDDDDETDFWEAQFSSGEDGGAVNCTERMIGWPAGPTSPSPPGPRLLRRSCSRSRRSSSASSSSATWVAGHRMFGASRRRADQEMWPRDGLHALLKADVAVSLLVLLILVFRMSRSARSGRGRRSLA